MADRAHSLPENVAGPFFVDSTCIDCDTCRQIAPQTFGETGEFSFVQRQPRGVDEERAAFRALVACPTASIGSLDKGGARDAVGEFPWPVTEGLWYCGFASRKSFGGSSYFMQHPGGNWLVDSPRYVEHLARRFDKMGGLRYIFLTHRDDVADAERYAARFGATRIIHRLELAAQPGAERVIDGEEAQELAPGFLAIPTPGHTRGHVALLYDNRILFSGDHLWWSRARGRLNASRDVCWYSWRQQVESVKLLAGYEFEWVLPGHGERVHFPKEEMKSELEKLIATL
jgi:glyoxylase-like metal-dependent hydrolase (beta-lactamase superfamily II)/ferredoxin